MNSAKGKYQGTSYAQLVGTYIQRGHKHGHCKRKIMWNEERVVGATHIESSTS
jgi:hypothetical protein